MTKPATSTKTIGEFEIVHNRREHGGGWTTYYCGTAIPRLNARYRATAIERVERLIAGGRFANMTLADVKAIATAG